MPFGHFCLFDLAGGGQRSQMNQRLQRLLIKGACAAMLLSIGACTKAPLSDDQTGFIDLVPFYPAPLVNNLPNANPNAGLPIIIAPKRGWVGGTRIEYYDFGPAGNVRKRDSKGSEIRDPAYANAYPMYFFFDSQGRPLFSKPAYDIQTGVWRMKGGQSPINPSPVAAPAADPDKQDFYNTVYLLRPRDVLYDDARGSSQFQRPVIDNLSVNSTTANTTGLFEVVEITVNDSAYEPDAIKTAATVLKGISDGRLSQRNTGKVINCPLVDERTQVLPSSMANNIPRPRVEYWYRTKLGECYLVNGWETIGETIDESKTAKDPANLRLFGTADFDKRVPTLDGFGYSVGTGQNEADAIGATVTKLYTPTATVGVVKTRLTNDDIAPALPRHKLSDTGGYSPIAWLWDLNLPQSPAYQPGSIRDIANVDLGAAIARDVSPTVTTSNIAIIGAATKCVTDADCKWGMSCNLLPDDNLATSTPDVAVNPGTNIVDIMIAREGGPRCDAPVVGYGQYCSPGISRCDIQTPAGGGSDTALKKIGVASAGPTFTVHADKAAADTALKDAMAKLAALDATMPMDPAYLAAQAAVTAAQNTLNGLTTRVAAYDALGYTTDFAGFGYFCYPPLLGTSNPPTLGGFCHIRCDSGASSTASMVNVDLLPGDPQAFQNAFAGEARCGGLNMLGYKCLPTTQTDRPTDRQRVCLRSCNVRNTDRQNEAICEYPFNQKADGANPNTSYSLSNGQPARAAIVGQGCFSVSSTAANGSATATTAACNWIPDFEPRNPAEWTGP
jgi:hypothetical protein